MNTSIPSSSSSTDSPIHSGAQAVVDLFDSDLVQLKFPDIDQSVLGEAAARVLTLGDAVAAAEVALAAAREALGDAQELLLGKCQRALAYARVYAEEDRELLRKVEAISLPRARTKATVTSTAELVEPKAGRRGRRTPPASGPLFLDPAGSGPPSEEATGADSCAA